MTALIEVKNLSKSFASTVSGNESLLVVSNLNLRLEHGELVTIFGPNGSGKSTILHLLAGLFPPDSGTVVRNSGKKSSLSIGYVFQNYSDTLLPWRTVRGNIAFPLELRHISKKEKIDRVNKRMEQFHLMEHANKYIYQLSGGLKQLVAIAQATVYDPQLLLLDEPFSALDYSLSRMLWLRFREFWTHQKVTTVFISHNVDEAVFLGDRVLVISSRPAQVVEEIIVPFRMERTLSLLSSPEFFSVRTQVLNAFERGRQP